MGRKARGRGGEVPPAVCPPGGTAATRRALLGPGDAELFHLLLQRGTLHPQAGRGPLRTAYHPAGFAEGPEEAIPLGVGQGNHCSGWHLVLCARETQVADAASWS